MATGGLIVLFVGALVALLIGGGFASPIPVISSVQVVKQQEVVAVNLAGDKSSPSAQAVELIASSLQQQQPNTIQTTGIAIDIAAANKPTRPNNAEKLKRGLTNFMNQMNPGPFFVPTPPAHQQHGDSKLVTKTSAGGGSQSSAEPAAIVNGDPTADTLIKGPNRLTQTRPIGGPLRWGRRR